MPNDSDNMLVLDGLRLRNEKDSRRELQVKQLQQVAEQIQKTLSSF